MNIISIECSTDICSVSSFKNNKLKNIIDTVAKRGSSDTLPLMLQSIIKDFDGFEEIDSFAVSIGPGSFTSLRTSISLVKGMAFAFKKDIIPVPTFESMNYFINDKNPHYIILNSFKDKCYIQKFKNSQNLGDPYIECIKNLKDIDLPIYGYSVMPIKQSNYKEVKPSAIILGEYALANSKKLITSYKGPVNPIYISNNKYIEINDDSH